MQLEFWFRDLPSCSDQIIISATAFIASIFIIIIINQQTHHFSFFPSTKFTRYSGQKYHVQTVVAKIQQIQTSQEACQKRNGRLLAKAHNVTFLLEENICLNLERGLRYLIVA